MEDELPKKYEAIDRYNTAQSPVKMLESYVENYSKTLPPKKAELFRDVMLNEFDLGVLTESVKPIMAKHFSLAELNALADFYESPHGLSAMSKMGPYMADLQPIFSGELLRVMKIWQEKYKETE